MILKKVLSENYFINIFAKWEIWNFSGSRILNTNPYHVTPLFEDLDKRK